MAENDLEGIGRPPSAPGGQQANAEEMLAELVRLVKSSGLAPKRRPPPVEPPPVEIVPEQSLPDSGATARNEVAALSIEAPSRQPKETALVGVEPIRATRSDDSPSNDPNAIGLAAGRRSGAWTFRVSALALAAAAAVGAIFWLEQIKSEPPKAPPLLSAAQSPAMAPPRANPSVATSSEAGATPPKDMTQPAEGKAVSPEQRPIDPNARASLENPPPSQDLGPTAGGVARPEALPAAKPPAAPVDTPAAAAPVAAPPPAASQSPEKAAPAVSLPPEPTPAATPSPRRRRDGRGAPKRCAVAAGQAGAEGRGPGEWGGAAPDAQTRVAHQAFRPDWRSRRRQGWSDRRRGSPVAERAASAWGGGEPREQGGASLGRTAGGPTGATGAGPQAAKRQSCGARLRHCGGRGRRGGRPHSVRTPLMGCIGP